MSVPFIPDTFVSHHGSWPGVGNIDADPHFVSLRNWANADDSNADGDYHLKSAGGRWNTEIRTWIRDDVTSACIDAGDPDSPGGAELLFVPDDPDKERGENLRINMGAYGGTAQASISPHE